MCSGVTGLPDTTLEFGKEENVLSLVQRMTSHGIDLGSGDDPDSDSTCPVEFGADGSVLGLVNFVNAVSGGVADGPGVVMQVEGVIPPQRNNNKFLPVVSPSETFVPFASLNELTNPTNEMGMFFRKRTKPEEIDGALLWNTEHVRQRWSWDCGLACVASCLSTLDRSLLLANTEKYSNAETGFGFRHSTWTIDLAYLLKHFGVNNKMFTSTMGVNAPFRFESYYKNLEQDAGRVTKRFEERDKYGVVVQLKKLDIASILFLLKESGPLIVLTNCNILKCHLCRWSTIRSACTKLTRTKYVGHFILAVGYNRKSRTIQYHDPGQSTARLCSTSFENFDAARSSFGTDDDVIVIEKKY